MRISDWSSDVCSSDLLDLLPDGLAPLAEPAQLVEEDHQRHTERHRVRDAPLARSPASHRAVVHLELLRQGRLPPPCPIEADAELAQPEISRGSCRDRG